MVKSFHKKRKNFKNKTKRNKQRRTRKNKNKKMIGGEIGDTASYLGNHVFVGYKVQPVTGGNIAGYNIGSSDVTTSIFVNKNFRNDITNYVNVNYPTKHGNHEPFFPNNIFKNNLFDLLNPLNTDLITGNYWDANNNWGIKNPHIKNILILPYLNLLPNVKNINIYKMILSGVVCFTDEDGNKSINDIINNSNREVIEKMAEFIDFKYYKILEQKPNGTLYGNGSRSMIDDETFKRIYRERCEQLKNEIMTILDYGDGSYNNTNELMLFISTDRGQFDLKIPDNLNKNLRHPTQNGQELKNYLFLKDFIMSLEREYPSLIARVLLETDAELAGEEPRKNRMRRASSILEEGMKKLSSVQMKKESEKNNEEIIKKISSEEKIKLPSSSSSLEIPSASSSSSEESPSNLKQIPIESKKEKSTWRELISTKYNRPYWVNSITGDSVWEKPQELKEYDSEGTPFPPSSDDEKQMFIINVTKYLDKYTNLNSKEKNKLISELENFDNLNNLIIQQKDEIFKDFIMYLNREFYKFYTFEHFYNNFLSSYKNEKSKNNVHIPSEYLLSRPSKYSSNKKNIDSEEEDIDSEEEDRFRLFKKK